MKKTNKLMVIGCGGTGINLAKLCAERYPTQDDSQANLAYAAIDSSESNLANIPDNIDVHLLEGVKGSGAVRTTNSELIAESAPYIAQDIELGDFNILLSSASGGTGGVVSSYLAKYMASEGIPFIVVMVGTYESNRHIENTMETIESLDAMSRESAVPFPMKWFELDSLASKRKLDLKICEFIAAFAVVSSGNTERLDGEDLRNFLRWDNVTEGTPSLTSIDLLVNAENDDFDDDHDYVSSLALYSAAVEHEFAHDLESDYHTTGALPDGTVDSIRSIVMTANIFLDDIVSPIKKKLEKQSSKKKKRKVVKAMGGKNVLK